MNKRKLMLTKGKRNTMEYSELNKIIKKKLKEDLKGTKKP